MAGGPLGAITGFLLGAGAGYLRQSGQQHLQQKQAQTAEEHQMMFDMLQKNPDMGDQKAAQDWLKKNAPDLAPGYASLAQLHRQHMQSFQQDTGPQQQNGQANLKPGTREYWNHRLSVAEPYVGDSDKTISGHAKSIVDEAKFQLQELDKQQATAGKGQVTPADLFKAGVTERGQDIQAGEKAATLDLAKQQAAANNNFRDALLSMHASQEKDKNETAFNTATQGLINEYKGISDDIAKATPIDATTAQTRLDKANAHARQVLQRAKRAGIPFDPEMFTPIKLKDIPGKLEKLSGGLIGSSTSEMVPDTGSSGAPDYKPFVGKRTRVHLKDGSTITGTVNADGSVTPD